MLDVGRPLGGWNRVFGCFICACVQPCELWCPAVKRRNQWFEWTRIASTHDSEARQQAMMLVGPAIPEGVYKTIIEAAIREAK